MPTIGRPLYQKAMEMILDANNFRMSKYKLGSILARKNERKIFLNIAGKNLPYYDKNGIAGFPWETYVNPNRLDRVERTSRELNSEPWIGFCYVILDKKLRKDFVTTISMQDFIFGARLISVDDYRKNMQPRSPSWGQVELPRKKTLQLTIDPSEF